MSRWLRQAFPWTPEPCALIREYRSEINARKTENAGTDHRNPSTKKVVTAIAMINRIPAKVNNGWTRKRMGKRSTRSGGRAFRNRRCVLRMTNQTNSIPATADPYNMRKAFFGAKMANRIGSDNARGRGQERAMRDTVAANLAHPARRITFPAQREEHSGGQIEVRVHAGKRCGQHNEIHHRRGERNVCGNECGNKRAARNSRTNCWPGSTAPWRP